MPSIKELNTKLKNYQSTMKITSAQKLVAASKLRHAEESTEHTRPYQSQLESLLADLQGSLADADGDSTSPWIIPREVHHISVVVFTSDRGLCGSFNNGLVRALEKSLGLREGEPEAGEFQSLAKLVAGGTKVTLHFAGKKAYEAMHSHIPQEMLGKHFESVTRHPSLSESRKISDQLIDDYLSGKTDAIYLALNHFVSVLTQTPKLLRVFPATPTKSSKAKSILFDPDAATVLSSLVPQSIRFLILSALLENAAGEHGARMTAMDNATRNAKEMIAKTSLLKNRVRQANITNELTEIISGAESIKS